MADYYPLLSRAVGALSDSNADARRSIYERARKALVGQLQAIQPPIAEADIARETDALDAAVARIEAEIAGKAAAETAAAPEAAAAAPETTTPPKTAPTTAPTTAPPPEAVKPAPPKPPIPAAPKPAPAGSEAAKPAPPKPLMPPPRPAPPKPPAPAGLKPAAPEPAPIPPTPPKPFSFRPPAAAEAEKAARKAELETNEAEKAEAQDSAAKPDASKVDVAKPDIAKPDDAELETPPTLKPPRPREAPRPAAPTPPSQNARGNRLWIVGGVVVGIALLIAGLAIKLRGGPEDLAKFKPAPTAPVEQAPSGKSGSRVGGETPAAPTQKTENKPATPATTSTPAQNQPPLPVAHRAALLLEAPETAEKVKTYIGSVVWRLDNVPGGPGQPLGTAVHAEVDIPEAKVRMTIDIQKNLDTSLNASHTIEVRFALPPGSVIPGVKQIGAVQMRREDMANGDALAGVPVPITETYYLVGLQRGDMEARNMDLLKTRGWLDVPLALTNGRIAKFSLEKGASGDRVINDALSVWAQQK